MGVKSLESVVIPEGVTEIGEMAFFWCKNLEGVVIPEGRDGNRGECVQGLQ